MSGTSPSEEEEAMEIEEAEDDDDEEEEEGDDQSNQNELEAWRQVHEHLTKAVGIAREAVAAKKLQRRFLMEEICGNMMEEGKLTQTSVWKRPVQPKKTAKKSAPKQKETTTKKRKKKAEPKPKRTKKKKKEKAIDEDMEDEEEPKAKKIRLKLKKPAAKRSSPPPVAASASIEYHDNDSQGTTDEDGDESEAEGGTGVNYHRDTGGPMHATEYSGHTWGSGHHNSYMVRKTHTCLDCDCFTLIILTLSFENDIFCGLGQHWLRKEY